jgi:hypothetical protein
MNTSVSRKSSVTADREEIENGDQQEARDEHRFQHRLEVLLVEEPPELRVEPEQREDHELHPDRDRDRVRDQVVVAERNALVEAQDVREVVRERDQACVHADLSQAANAD